MKTITKKKRRKKFKLVNFTVLFFLFSAICYLASTLFLRSYNNSLSTDKQLMEAEIAELQIKNDAVAVEVNTLNNRERVTGIASDNGLSLDQDNIITITRTEGD